MKKSRKSYELDYKRQIVGEYVSGKTSVMTQLNLRKRHAKAVLTIRV